MLCGLLLNLYYHHNQSMCIFFKGSAIWLYIILLVSVFLRVHVAPKTLLSCESDKQAPFPCLSALIIN